MSHSPNKPGGGREEQGRTEGRLEANLALPPLSHLFPLSTLSCTHEPLTRRVLEEVSGQIVPRTCYVTLGKTLPSVGLEKTTLKVPSYRMHESPMRQGREVGCALGVLEAASAHFLVSVSSVTFEMRRGQVLGRHRGQGAEG